MNIIGRRQIHTELLSLLRDDDHDRSMAAIKEYANRRVIGPLFSFFYRDEPHIRWRAITAMGEAVKQIADRDLEYARNIMRRLIWNLNDESGGIGWGSSEAMGEIMAREPQLAEEFGPLLASYIREDRNRPDHPDLQAGALWGLGRLAHVRPNLVCAVAPFLGPFLLDDRSTLRGLAAWVSQAIFHESLRPALTSAESDPAILSLYQGWTFLETTVGRLAAVSLMRNPPKNRERSISTGFETRRIIPRLIQRSDPECVEGAGRFHA